ncbi:MAG: extracellular solute-binding protein [Clostridiales bacterium]|nr:extracellular solute-binding protein [Clostridiales bacterium]
MRRLIAGILALLMMAGYAMADAPQAPDYVLEGYDGDSTGVTWETNLFFTRMQERTGISFQFSQARNETEWKERKTAILEGKNLPDVLFKADLTPAETRKMYEGGVIIDLKPYLEENAPDLWALLQEHPDWLEAITLPDGAIAALPAFNNMQNNDAMWINTRWLERMGLDTPATAEELTEVLRAFKTKDPNGNRSADEVPLTFIGMWELRFLGHAFGIIDNDYYVSVKDGKVVSSLTTEENRAFLSWLHQLWDEDLLDHNGFTTTDSLRQITDENKTIPYGMMMNATPLNVVPSSALDQFRLLLPLEYEGKQVYRDLAGSVIRGTFAITSACKDPAELVRWVNFLYTEEGARLAQYGEEGTEYSFTENGTWEWNEDLSTIAQITLPSNTISFGLPAPGIAAEEFQKKYVEDTTRETVEQMAELKKYSVLPYPYVYLSDEDAAAIAALQADIMGYAEEAMACFVTGDLELNDENWNTFCETVRAKGLEDEISIWQKYVSNGAD